MGGSILCIPVSSSLSYSTSSGSILGIFFLLQILTGLLVSISYDNSMGAFDSVQVICIDSSIGWVVRSIHCWGSNSIFLLLFFHVGKAVLSESYRSIRVYVVGLGLLVLSILVAFLGYVLVYSQISYWAAIVITGLLSVVSYDLSYWLWSNFSVSEYTVKTFFTLHFMLPLIIPIGIIVHMSYLHTIGSTSNSGSSYTLQTVEFYSYYWLKDILNVLFILSLICSYLLYSEYTSELEIYDPSNSINSPDHIVPQWYFLWAYAILRAFPSNSLGVSLFVLAVGVLVVLIYSSDLYTMFKSSVFILFIHIVCTILVLSILGSLPAESPFVVLSLVFSVVYFGWYVVVVCSSGM